MREFHIRMMTLPNGTVVRTTLSNAHADLSDEELLERYPAVAEILARWEREEAS